LNDECGGCAAICPFGNVSKIGKPVSVSNARKEFRAVKVTGSRRAILMHYYQRKHFLGQRSDAWVTPFRSSGQQVGNSTNEEKFHL
jgi:Fe-S-cluster-containing hydrogenase component 2